MLIQYDFNRKTLENFLSSIHPINKKTRGVFTNTFSRAESPNKTIFPLLDLPLHQESFESPTPGQRPSRGPTPIRFRLKARNYSPVEPRLNFINLKGLSINLKKKSKTPVRFNSPGKKIVTKLPFVKWSK